MYISLGAYLHSRDLVKDLGFLVGTPKLPSQCEPPWSQLTESIPMQSPPGHLSACQGRGEGVVRTDELVRGPGRGSAGRTDLPGREPPPEEGRGCGDVRSPSANRRVRTGESITACLVTPPQLLLSAGLASLLTYAGEWESGRDLSHGTCARAGPLQGCTLLALCCPWGHTWGLS